MAKKSSLTKINFNQLSLAWVSFTLASVVVILLANLFFPKAVVLGHHLISPFWGAMAAAAIISLIAVGFMPVIEAVAEQKKIILTSSHWLVIFWMIDAMSVWLMGRMAEVVGLGIKSWLVAVMLGLAINLIQGSLMVQLVGKVKSE